jgi:hypothetical protein
MGRVFFDADADFENILLEATKRNNSEEIELIIKNINSQVYPDHVTLSKTIMQMVDELDPFDRDSVVDHVMENMSPENKSLFKPQAILEVSRQKSKRWLKFGCFS